MIFTVHATRSSFLFVFSRLAPKTGPSWPSLTDETHVQDAVIEVEVVEEVHFCFSGWVNVDMGVSKNRGTPKRMVYNGKPKTLLKMDDLGVPLFSETPIDCLYCNFVACMVFPGDTFSIGRFMIRMWIGMVANGIHEIKMLYSIYIKISTSDHGNPTTFLPF